MMTSDCRIEFTGAPFHRADASRSAVIAHWWPDATVSRSASVLLRQLCANGFAVTLVSTCTAEGALSDLHDPDLAVRILRRPNIGHDFGSWTNALLFDSTLLNSRELLITNDSLVGPFDDISTLLDPVGSEDVTGLTMSTELGTRHLQSYWLHHRNGSSINDAIREFWLATSKLGSKDEIVRSFEIGYSQLLTKQGFEFAPKFETPLSWETELNPTIHEWRQLLESGMPFVKRELLWKPGVGPGSGYLEEHVDRCFGEDVWNWIPDRGEDRSRFRDATTGIKLSHLHPYRTWPPPFVTEFRRAFDEKFAGSHLELRERDPQIELEAARISAVWVREFSPTYGKRVQRVLSKWRRRWNVVRTDPQRAIRKLKITLGLQP